MDRSVSWWDCGEFISTGWLLQVGHPSGAPFYQLLSHLFMLLSFGNTALVAPLSNAVSALCGGITVGILYATVKQLGIRPFGALVAALCYLFADSVWFSATESEVYAMAMLFCSLNVYLAVLYRESHNPRLLPLMGLLLGLGIGVHMMTLLTLPAMMLLIAGKHLRPRMLLPTLLFFMLGLTPYAIIPIRAAANPPINEGDPSNAERFASYIKRDQYEKAPLYPRMWRERDSANWSEWNAGGRTDFLGNAAYCCSYQLGYMYGRYLLDNFAGRINRHWHCTVLFILPGLLGLWGLVRHRRRSRHGFWVVMLLFLFGGIILNLYLNHPCYEPRERDYVYVLSYYAFAIWIGVGVDELACLRRWQWLALLAPMAMAVGNWSDHDRSHCHSVHDIAMAHLQSCDDDAILITLGDNDTFPLWYLQQVERQRTDIDIYNVGLTGWGNILGVLIDNNYHRPIYVSQYFYDRFGRNLSPYFRCEGFCWRMLPSEEGADNLEPLRRHVSDSIHWHITEREYVDEVSQSFLDIWNRNTKILTQ